MVTTVTRNATNGFFSLSRVRLVERVDGIVAGELERPEHGT